MFDHLLVGEAQDGDALTAEEGVAESVTSLSCCDRNVTPHVAQDTSRRRSALDARTTRHPGYAVSLKVRKRVEEIFGWMKTVGGFRKTRFKGRERTELAAYLVGAAYNLLRMASLTAA